MTLPLNPVMYLLSDPSIPMSKGKFGAQAAHAAVEAYRITPDNWMKHCWSERGGHYAKIVLQCDNLLLAQKYIEARGIQTVLILDEGRTEFDADLTPTFLGVEVVNKNDASVKATFGAFKLYRDRPLAASLPPAAPDRSAFFKLKESAREFFSRRESGDA